MGNPRVLEKAHETLESRGGDRIVQECAKPTAARKEEASFEAKQLKEPLQGVKQVEAPQKDATRGYNLGHN